MNQSGDFAISVKADLNQPVGRTSAYSPPHRRPCESRSDDDEGRLASPCELNESDLVVVQAILDPCDQSACSLTTNYRSPPTTKPDLLTDSSPIPYIQSNSCQPPPPVRMKKSVRELYGQPSWWGEDDNDDDEFGTTTTKQASSSIHHNSSPSHHLTSSAKQNPSSHTDNLVDKVEQQQSRRPGESFVVSLEPTPASDGSQQPPTTADSPSKNEPDVATVSLSQCVPARLRAGLDQRERLKRQRQAESRSAAEAANKIDQTTNNKRPVTARSRPTTTVAANSSTSRPTQRASTRPTSSSTRPSATVSRGGGGRAGGNATSSLHRPATQKPVSTPNRSISRTTKTTMNGNTTQPPSFPRQSSASSRSQRPTATADSPSTPRKGTATAALNNATRRPLTLSNIVSSARRPSAADTTRSDGVRRIPPSVRPTTARTGYMTPTASSGAKRVLQANNNQSATALTTPRSAAPRLPTTPARLASAIRRQVPSATSKQQVTSGRPLTTTTGTFKRPINASNNKPTDRSQRAAGKSDVKLSSVAASVLAKIEAFDDPKDYLFYRMFEDIASQELCPPSVMSVTSGSTDDLLMSSSQLDQPLTSTLPPTTVNPQQQQPLDDLLRKTYVISSSSANPGNDRSSSPVRDDGSSERPLQPTDSIASLAATYILSKPEGRGKAARSGSTSTCSQVSTATTPRADSTTLADWTEPTTPLSLAHSQMELLARQVHSASLHKNTPPSMPRRPPAAAESKVNPQPPPVSSSLPPTQKSPDVVAGASPTDLTASAVSLANTYVLEPDQVVTPGLQQTEYVDAPPGTGTSLANNPSLWRLDEEDRSDSLAVHNNDPLEENCDTLEVLLGGEVDDYDDDENFQRLPDMLSSWQRDDKTRQVSAFNFDDLVATRQPNQSPSCDNNNLTTPVAVTNPATTVTRGWPGSSQLKSSIPINHLDSTQLALNLLESSSSSSSATSPCNRVNDTVVDDADEEGAGPGYRQVEQSLSRLLEAHGPFNSDYTYLARGNNDGLSMYRSTNRTLSNRNSLERVSTYSHQQPKRHSLDASGWSPTHQFVSPSIRQPHTSSHRPESLDRRPRRSSQQQILDSSNSHLFSPIRSPRPPQEAASSTSRPSYPQTDQPMHSYPDADPIAGPLPSFDPRTFTRAGGRHRLPIEDNLQSYEACAAYFSALSDNLESIVDDVEPTRVGDKTYDESSPVITSSTSTNHAVLPDSSTGGSGGGQLTALTGSAFVTPLPHRLARSLRQQAQIDPFKACSNNHDPTSPPSSSLSLTSPPPGIPTSSSGLETDCSTYYSSMVDSIRALSIQLRDCSNKLISQVSASSSSRLQQRPAHSSQDSRRSTLTSSSDDKTSGSIPSTSTKHALGDALQNMRLIQDQLKTVDQLLFSAGLDQSQQMIDGSALVNTSLSQLCQLKQRLSASFAPIDNDDNDIHNPATSRGGWPPLFTTSQDSLNDGDDPS